MLIVAISILILLTVGGIAVLSLTAVVVNMSRSGWALLFSVGPDTFGVIWQVKLKRVQP